MVLTDVLMALVVVNLRVKSISLDVSKFDRLN